MIEVREKLTKSSRIGVCKMNKKKVGRIFHIIAAVSLVIGASFHGYRMHPEDVAKYNIGVTMGIVMISIFAISFIVAIIFTILTRKEGKS